MGLVIQRVKRRIRKMLKFKEDGKCSRWDELWSHTYFYDKKCDGCKWIEELAGRKFCGKIEGARVAMHETIRGQIGCNFCRNYTKPLKAKVCQDCIRNHPDAKVFEMYKEIYIDDKEREGKEKWLKF